MIETKTLLPGVTLRSCRDDRFKQGCLSFQLVRPMAKEESAKNVLIPSVLLRGTKRCPDLRAITENLDELYGASVSPLVRRVGDYQTTGLYCGFMDDRFALPGDRVLAPMLRFLEEILLDFPTEGEGFLPAFVEGEKKNLISTIDSELNDKRTYAMGKLLKTMCRGDSFGLPRFWAVLWAKLRFPVGAADPLPGNPPGKQNRNFLRRQRPGGGGRGIYFPAGIPAGRPGRPAPAPDALPSLPRPGCDGDDGGLPGEALHGLCHARCQPG